MSNCSLLEVNHDFAAIIDGDQEGFVRALGCYLASGDKKRWRDALRRFGVTPLAIRHHTEEFSVQWGSEIVTDEMQR